MAFVQKRIQQHTAGFGADLTELRELRGYSRERLSKISGIHTLLITALEGEQFQNIGDPVYAERHVRTLVKILEGRSDFFIKKYRELLIENKLAHAPERTLRPKARKRDFFVVSRLVVFLGFSFLACTIGAYVFYTAREITKAPLLVVVAPVEGAKVHSPHVGIQGNTDEQAEIWINGQSAIVNADGSFLSVIDVPSGVSTIRIEARRRYSNATTIERHLMFEKIATSTPLGLETP